MKDYINKTQTKYFYWLIDWVTGMYSTLASSNTPSALFFQFLFQTHARGHIHWCWLSKKRPLQSCSQTARRRSYGCKLSNNIPADDVEEMRMMMMKRMKRRMGNRNRQSHLWLITKVQELILVIFVYYYYYYCILKLFLMCSYNTPSLLICLAFNWNSVVIKYYWKSNNANW